MYPFYITNSSSSSSSNSSSSSSISTFRTSPISTNTITNGKEENDDYHDKKNYTDHNDNSKRIIDKIDNPTVTTDYDDNEKE